MRIGIVQGIGCLFRTYEKNQRVSIHVDIGNIHGQSNIARNQAIRMMVMALKREHLHYRFKYKQCKHLNFEGRGRSIVHDENDIVMRITSGYDIYQIYHIRSANAYLAGSKPCKSLLLMATGGWKRIWQWTDT